MTHYLICADHNGLTYYYHGRKNNLHKKPKFALAICSMPGWYIKSYINKNNALREIEKLRPYYKDDVKLYLDEILDD